MLLQATLIIINVAAQSENFIAIFEEKEIELNQNGQTCSCVGSKRCGNSSPHK